MFGQLAGEVVDALDELGQDRLRRARRIGRAKLALQLLHGRQMLAVLSMQILDQAPDERVAALFHHWEEPHLLLEHVLLERIADRGQLLDQADMETECDGLAGQG